MLHLIRTAVTIFTMIGLITGVVYPLAATGLAQLFFPWQANGSIIKIGGGKAASMRCSNTSTPAPVSTDNGMTGWKLPFATALSRSASMTSNPMHQCRCQQGVSFLLYTP